MQSSNWTPKHSQALRDYLAKGMSYSAVADAINKKFKTAYSRSAAIGRAKRMGLVDPNRPKPSSGNLVPRYQGCRSDRAPSQRTRERDISEFWGLPPIFESMEAVKLRCADVVPRHLSLMDLESGDCRYPYGGDQEGEAITFCGHTKRLGSSYCAAHFDLSIGPGTASERAAGSIPAEIAEAA